jgi:hypothetical protein
VPAGNGAWCLRFANVLLTYVRRRIMNVSRTYRER